MIFRRVVVFFLVLATNQAFADGPAVDGVNGKLSVLAGQSAGSDASLVEGNITFPISHSFGAQLDGGQSRHQSINSNSIGGHFFWRDPESALFGITASRYQYGYATADQTIQRVGLEVEKYVSNITLSARIGNQKHNFSLPFWNQSDSSVYANLRGTWYANENLAFNVRVQHVATTSAGLDVEWLPGLNGMPGLSIVGLMSHNIQTTDNAGFLGVRYYFDTNKTLIKHHRTGDPEGSSLPYIAGLTCQDMGMTGNQPRCHLRSPQESPIPLPRLPAEWHTDFYRN